MTDNIKIKENVIELLKMLSEKNIHPPHMK